MKFEEQPQFIKEFSKSESLEERNRLAQEIREKKKSAFLEENEQLENKEVNSIIKLLPDYSNMHYDLISPNSNITMYSFQANPTDKLFL